VESTQRFAANLHEHRLRRGLSQEALAHASDVHPSQVGRIERASRDPRLSTVVKLARGLGVAPAELLAGIG
jgi:transcriptional regulator with XRE-family HTH domain